LSHTPSEKYPGIVAFGRTEHHHALLFSFSFLPAIQGGNRSGPSRFARRSPSLSSLFLWPMPAGVVSLPLQATLPSLSGPRAINRERAFFLLRSSTLSRDVRTRFFLSLCSPPPFFGNIKSTMSRSTSFSFFFQAYSRKLWRENLPSSLFSLSFSSRMNPFLCFSRDR